VAAGERWQVSGNAADVYERQLVPAIFAPWAPVVLDLAARRAGPDGLVIGLDLNPGMLAVAAGPPGSPGCGGAIRWRSSHRLGCDTAPSRPA
jgi:hypothetical protein